MNNVNEQLDRMKAMMTYGLQVESKKQPYSSVEYSKVGADNKMYGIVREGTKYYIKVSNNSKDVIKENFDYIGGFVNRKNNEFSSYANALKQFDLKMMNLKESHSNGKNIIIESWNPDKQQVLAEEATASMRKEIMRQRQIMSNASLIKEGKDGCCCDSVDAPFCCDVDKEYVVGKDKKQECDPVKTDDNSTDTCAEVVAEAAEPLAWHKDGGDAKQNIADTYMDTSHGTEVGSDAPFEKPLHSTNQEAEHGVVAESEDWGSEGLPQSAGVGEIGNDAPFDDKEGKQLQEDLNFDDADNLADGAEGYDAEYATEDDEDSPLGDDFENDSLNDEPMDDEPMGDEPMGNDVEGRLSSIEDTLATILDKLSALESEDFESDDLYDDADEMDDEPMDDEMDDDAQIYESKSYRQMRLAEESNRLDVFGKHPAYQKKVMELPTTGEDKNAHGRDWNDDSVHSEQPYGEKIGDSAPFDVDVKDIENAIVECLRRLNVIK